MTSLDDAFTYHPPANQRQTELYQEIRAAGKTFATLITDELADSQRLLTTAEQRCQTPTDT